MREALLFHGHHPSPRSKQTSCGEFGLVLPPEDSPRRNRADVLAGLSARSRRTSLFWPNPREGSSISRTPSLRPCAASFPPRSRPAHPQPLQLARRHQQPHCLRRRPPNPPNRRKFQESSPTAGAAANPTRHPPKHEQLKQQHQHHQHQQPN